MSDKRIFFLMHGYKKDGEERSKECKTINEAIHALWKLRNVKEAFVSMLIDGKRTPILVKRGRRRGVNTQLTDVVDGRPFVNKETKKWQRLPSRFNELE